MTFTVCRSVTLKQGGTVTTLTPGDTIDLLPDKAVKLLKAGVIAPTPYHPTPEQIEQAARELEIDLDDPVMLKGLVEMLTDKYYLDRVQVPPSYTSTTFCRGCKTTVPIFVGCPETVEACPWCHRRWELYE